MLSSEFDFSKNLKPADRTRLSIAMKGGGSHLIPQKYYDVDNMIDVIEKFDTFPDNMTDNDVIYNYLINTNNIQGKMENELRKIVDNKKDKIVNSIVSAIHFSSDNKNYENFDVLKEKLGKYLQHFIVDTIYLSYGIADETVYYLLNFGDIVIPGTFAVAITNEIHLDEVTHELKNKTSKVDNLTLKLTNLNSENTTMKNELDICQTHLDRSLTDADVCMTKLKENDAEVGMLHYQLDTCNEKTGKLGLELNDALQTLDVCNENLKTIAENPYSKTSPKLKSQKNSPEMKESKKNKGKK